MKARVRVYWVERGAPKRLAGRFKDRTEAETFCGIESLQMEAADGNGKFEITERRIENARAGKVV